MSFHVLASGCGAQRAGPARGTKLALSAYEQLDGLSERAEKRLCLRALSWEGRWRSRAGRSRRGAGRRRGAPRPAAARVRRDEGEAPPAGRPGCEDLASKDTRYGPEAFAPAPRCAQVKDGQLAFPRSWAGENTQLGGTALLTDPHLQQPDDFTERQQQPWAFSWAAALRWSRISFPPAALRRWAGSERSCLISLRPEQPA